MNWACRSASAAGQATWQAETPRRSGRRGGPRDRNPFPLGDRRGPRRLGREPATIAARCERWTLRQTSSCRWPPRSSWCPSTWKTIERTLRLLDDRGVREVRIFAIACHDDEPSSWAISARELVAAAHWIEQSARMNSSSPGIRRGNLIRRGPWPSKSVAARGRRRMPCGSSPMAA